MNVLTDVQENHKKPPKNGILFVYKVVLYVLDKRKPKLGKGEKEAVKKINVKPLMALQRLNSNKDKSLSIPLTGSVSSEKTKSTSIHDLLDQLQIDPNNKGKI